MGGPARRHSIETQGPADVGCVGFAHGVRTLSWKVITDCRRQMACGRDVWRAKDLSSAYRIGRRNV